MDNYIHTHCVCIVILLIRFTPSQKGLCGWVSQVGQREVCGVVGEDSPESGGPAHGSPASDKMTGNENDNVHTVLLMYGLHQEFGENKP